MPEDFEVLIVYGTNKPLRVAETEKIGQAKTDALNLFKIPQSEADKFVLKTEVEGKEVQLNEADTVAFYKIKPGQKIKLASGAPYGKQNSGAGVKRLHS